MNYFTPQLLEKEGGREVLIDSIETTKVAGRLWNGDRFENTIEIPTAELGNWLLEVHRFFGYDHLRYHGLYEFYISEFTLLPWRRWFFERSAQVMFNLSARFHKDQISVLKSIVGMHLASAPQVSPILHEPEEVSVIELFSRIYGRRIYGHPKYEAQSARFRLIVEALAANGDLIKNGSNFKLSPDALNTINKFEETERRHNDSVKLNRALVVLTFVIAAATVAQIYFCNLT
ncbi:hypothetical protein K3X41_01610 [Aliiroseovarius crassostreae]|uniref:hypothetical protein n=1 Tax=Aliiroseovarius crassostreae TaxID=154981 RepID=UPI00220C9B49|nr:hypothetical protein [Aliiroseovarius crassostreae]UWQ11426.1 hypothetical protein K3X41_01610 [Aliiroseovarius crassostreae]